MLRCRVALKAAGEKTNLSVQSTVGAVDNGDMAKRIIAALTKELK